MGPTPLFKALLLFAVVSGLAITGLAFGFSHKEDFDPQVRFSLSDQWGKSVSQTDFRGRYLLVFFGFTNCGNTCPIQVSKLTQMVKNLERADINMSVTPVFITVDLERDSAERPREYLQHFDAGFIGLNGPDQALARTSESFSAFFQRQQTIRVLIMMWLTAAGSM
jgi:protein SCO1